jgi:PAS domain S-box-containing protein
MINSIRYRLLTWFIAFMLLTAGLMIPANLFFSAREKKVTQISSDLNTLHIAFLQDSKSINDFLSIKPDKEDFFTRGHNAYLITHQRIGSEIETRLNNLAGQHLTHSFGIFQKLEQLSWELSQFNNQFDSLIYLVYKRGYRNFGLEGELSDYAELIEGADGLTSNDFYRLKKIETRYFSDNDTSAIEALETQLAVLSARVATSRKLNANQKARSIELIEHYTQAFFRLVKLDEQSGISQNIALRASLNQSGNRIEQLFSSLSAQAALKQKTLIQKINLFYEFSLLLILLMAVVFSYKASRHVVRHLETLANYISSLSKNNGSTSNSIDLRNSAREISQIYQEFRNLLLQLKIWEKQRDYAIQHADDNQQHYRELADMLPQSVFETDSYGNYTYVNKAWHTAFGYETGDLREGLNLIETLISESSDDDILGIQKIENSNFMAIRKNGSRFPASVYTDNIITNGKIAGRRGIVIDITDRINYIRTLQQETTKAKTSDELKSSFLANMSHEIRTPMNSIIGFSNLLASEQIPDGQKKDFTHYIRTSSEILLNLVDDIIDIAKIEAGELKIVKKECDLNALGKELLSTSLESKKRFNKQNIQLLFKADSGLQHMIKTDPFRLRQVMINLINNAIKFTDNGSVEFGYTVKDDQQIEFYVKDTGPGLSREELDMIFERFKRARRSEEKNIVGTGLGLAIAKNLVQLLGGEMWVDSTANVGTTFLFTIPYLRTTDLPAENDHTQLTDSDYNWNGKTLLIVEDDLTSFKFLNELLKKTGAEIIHAPNGAKAVEFVKNCDFIDLIIMDIQMPEMDGLEATRLIKAINSHLPVIAQTAYAMAGDKEKMKHAGCDDYVSKPLNSKIIMSSINRFLKTVDCKSNQRNQSALT